MTIYDKMACTWYLTLLLTALATADAGAYFYTPNRVQYSPSSALTFRHPLNILPERPFAAANSISSIPLYIVPRGLVRVLDPHAQVDPSDFTPGVRVILRRPLVVSSPTASISFPSGFTIDQEPGVRTPMNVGAVIAPVGVASSAPIQYPITVRIVYAVATIEPASFLPQQPSYYFPQYFYNFPPYSYQTALSVPQKPATVPETPVSTPRPSAADASPASQPAAEAEAEGDKPGAPPAGSPQLVTVLDFPTAVAEPGSLFFQPPLTGEEFGNREPPQGIVPAGIIQSAAPIPNLSVFVNSKESQYLQVLREEALKAKTQGRTPSYVVHGDTIQVESL